MFNDLLEPDYGVDVSPVDETNTNQFIFYYNDEDILAFKTLMKAAMKAEYPLTFQKANTSDTMLKILKRLYGTTNLTTAPEVNRGAGEPAGSNVPG